MQKSRKKKGIDMVIVDGEKAHDRVARATMWRFWRVLQDAVRIHIYEIFLLFF